MPINTRRASVPVAGGSLAWAWQGVGAAWSWVLHPGQAEALPGSNVTHTKCRAMEGQGWLCCAPGIQRVLGRGRGGRRAEWGSAAVALPRLAPVLPSAGSKRTAGIITVLSAMASRSAGTFATLAQIQKGLRPLWVPARAPRVLEPVPQSGGSAASLQPCRCPWHGCMHRAGRASMWARWGSAGQQPRAWKQWC